MSDKARIQAIYDLAAAQLQSAPVETNLWRDLKQITSLAVALGAMPLDIGAQTWVKINGQDHLLRVGHQLTYAELLKLLGASPAAHLTVVWHVRGTDESGSLLTTGVGHIIIRHGMSITAVNTGNA